RPPSTLFPYPTLFRSSLIPGISNFFIQTSRFRRVLGTILDLAPQRQLPRLAPMSFMRWARRNRPALFGEDKSVKAAPSNASHVRSEEHTSELQSPYDL